MNWMDILKNKPEFDRDAFYAAEPRSTSDDIRDNEYYVQFMKDLEKWYNANPLKLKYNDEEFYSKLDKLIDEEGGWPPSEGKEGVDYPKVSREEFDEYDEWYKRRLDFEVIDKIRSLNQADKDEELRLIREKEKEQEKFRAEHQKRLAQSKKAPKGKFGAKRTAGKRTPSWKRR